MRNRFLFFFLLAVVGAVHADDVTVPNTFTSGTTINSSQMNANFDALVQESNENDARINALSSSVNGSSFLWLGYTPNNFTYDPPTTIASRITLSNFCKSEFGDPAAVVATTDSFFKALAGQTIPLPEEGRIAVMLPEIVAVTAVNPGTGVDYALGMTRDGIQVRYDFCAFGYNGALECFLRDTSVNHQVACLKPTS